MIEIFHEMIRYFVHVREIFCCDCYFDDIYYLLRKKKKNYIYFEKNFSEKQNCYFDTVFASLIIVCYDFLRISKKIYSLSKSMCIETILSEDIHFCSICTIDLFKRVDEIIKFELRC